MIFYSWGILSISHNHDHLEKSVGTLQSYWNQKINILKPNSKNSQCNIFENGKVIMRWGESWRLSFGDGWWFKWCLRVIWDMFYVGNLLVWGNVRQFGIGCTKRPNWCISKWILEWFDIWPGDHFEWL